ncbi:MAG: hypothetical protein U0794_23340 [Isosphaeraceae bacterium]
MHVGAAILIGLLANVPVADSGSSPIAWSPDGSWLAWIRAGRATPGPEPDRLFGEPRRAEPDPHSGCALVLCDPDGRQSVELLRSEHALTAPAWRPDGKAIVVGRLVRNPAGKSLEVLIFEGLRSSRVLATLPLGPGEWDVPSTSNQAVSWSPDGRFLTVPSPSGRGFAIVRVDTGRVLKNLDEGREPSWSPDGGRLAFVRPGTKTVVCVLEAGFGVARELASLDQVSQGPVWSRDGRTLSVVNRNPASEVRRFGTRAILDLIRIDLESGGREAVRLTTDPPRPNDPWRGVSWTLDRDGDNLFYAVDLAGEASAVVWYRPRTDETLNRFNPIDISLRVGSLSLSPNGRHLAARFGPEGPFGPVGVWHTDTRAFTLLSPDPVETRAWVDLLAETASGLIRNALNGGKPFDPTQRATIVPVPGEIPQEKEILVRLHQVGVKGRSLGDRFPDDSTDTGSQRSRLEAQLLFEELSGRHGEALATLDRLEPLVGSADSRLRLLALRGQIRLGLGDLEGARDVVDYLARLGSKRAYQLEPTPTGPKLTELSGGPAAWSARLTQGIRQTEKGDSATRPRRRGEPPVIPGERDYPRDAGMRRIRRDAPFIPEPPNPAQAPIRPPF